MTTTQDSSTELGTASNAQPEPSTSTLPIGVVTLTPAQIRFGQLVDAIKVLPAQEQIEVAICEREMVILVQKFGSSAKLAIMKMALVVSVAEGQ